MLHLAAAASAFMHAKVRAAGGDALGRLALNRRQCRFFPVVLFAVGVGRDHLKRQRAVDKHHFAVQLVGDALGFDVERFDVQPLHGPLCPSFLSHFLSSFVSLY